MSFDLGIWHSKDRIDAEVAGEIYRGLCERTASPPQAHAAVDAFYRELIAKHPEIDTVPDDRIDDHDYCPWSCEIDHSPGHVIVSCVWSKADYVESLIRELARKHGLAVFDPQQECIHHPDRPVSSPGESQTKRSPWWRFW